MIKKVSLYRPGNSAICAFAEILPMILQAYFKNTLEIPLSFATKFAV